MYLHNLLFYLPHSTGKLNFRVCSPSQPWLYKKKIIFIVWSYFQAFDKAFENSYLKSVLTQKIIVQYLYPSRLCPVFRLWGQSLVKVAFRELLLALPWGLKEKQGLGHGAKDQRNVQQTATNQQKQRWRKIQLLMWLRLCYEEPGCPDIAAINRKLK